MHPSINRPTAGKPILFSPFLSRVRGIPARRRTSAESQRSMSSTAGKCDTRATRNVPNISGGIDGRRTDATETRAGRDAGAGDREQTEDSDFQRFGEDLFMLELQHRECAN